MDGFLPPSSIDARLDAVGGAVQDRRPGARLAVKVIALTPGWRVRSSPAESGRTVHDVVDAGGTPTLFITSPSIVAVVGVSSEGSPPPCCRRRAPGRPSTSSAARQVPRADDGDHALGHAHGVVDGALPSGVGISKNSVPTFFTVSAKTLKLAAPRGMSMCFARRRLAGVGHLASRNSSKRR
jgi:hypothetical protein